MLKRFFAFLFITILLAAIFAVCPAFAADSSATHTVTFDVLGIGETPDPITVNDGECYLYLHENGAHNPTADGYVFHCWVTTLDFEQDEVAMSNTAAYLETPITEDMTLYAVWYKVIDRVDVTLDAPVAGDVIGKDRCETEDYSFEYQSPRPDAAVTSEGARVQESFWTGVGLNAVWLEDADDPESTFYGTFRDGREYGVWMILEPIFGYEFADRLTVTLNGEPLPGPVTADYNGCTVTAPVYCSEKNPASDPNPAAVDTGDSALHVRPIALLILSAFAIIFIRRKMIKESTIH